MIKTIVLISILFFISGCSMMIGKSDYSCGSSEDLKDAGICGSTEYIRNNLQNMDTLAYRGMKKVNGSYTKCNGETDCNKKEIKEIRW